MAKHNVTIKTETLQRVSDEDFETMKSAADDFLVLAKKWGSFYTTLFLNEKNRKIVFKYAYGKLIGAEIEKLDEDGE